MTHNKTTCKLLSEAKKMAKFKAAQVQTKITKVAQN